LGPTGHGVSTGQSANLDKGLTKIPEFVPTGSTMSAFSPFGIPGFDPSKMDPKVLMELSQLMQRLPPEQLSKMQTLMHNTMAGFDTKKDLEEFERNLPPDFREKILKIMGGAAVPQPIPSIQVPETVQESSLEAALEMDLHQARLTILRAVASGGMSPEEAEKLLFSA
jgi:hypothetical protein